MGATLLLPVVSDLLTKLMNRVMPDPQQQAQMQIQLAQMAQNGELQAMTTQLSAIVAEAQSQDKWTSRARPSFMYVMYIMILASVPMGVLYAFNPALALNIASGLKQWLNAIPDSLYTLFGVGYLGYTGARSIEKSKGLTK